MTLGGTYWKGGGKELTLFKEIHLVKLSMSSRSSFCKCQVNIRRSYLHAQAQVSTLMLSTALGFSSLGYYYNPTLSAANFLCFAGWWARYREERKFLEENGAFYCILLHFTAASNYKFNYFIYSLPLMVIINIQILCNSIISLAAASKKSYYSDWSHQLCHLCLCFFCQIPLWSSSLCGSLP